MVNLPYATAYRNYTCNIKTPKVSCKKLFITGSELDLNGIVQVAHVDPTFSTEHIIDETTLPAMNIGLYNWIGELTCRVKDEDGHLGLFKVILHKQGLRDYVVVTPSTKVSTFSVFTIVADPGRDNRNRLIITTDLPCYLSWYFVG